MYDAPFTEPLHQPADYCALHDHADKPGEGENVSDFAHADRVTVPEIAPLSKQRKPRNESRERERKQQPLYELSREFSIPKILSGLSPGNERQAPTTRTWIVKRGVDIPCYYPKFYHPDADPAERVIISVFEGDVYYDLSSP